MTTRLATHGVRCFSPIRVLLHHFQALQCLEDLPRHVPGAHAEVGRAHPVPLSPSVHLDHGSDAHPPSQVQVASCGCWRDINDAMPGMFHYGLRRRVPTRDMKSDIPAYQICPRGGLELLSTCQITCCAADTEMWGMLSLYICCVGSNTLHD